MSLARSITNNDGERAWHCIEFIDELRGYHGLSAAYQTEREALGVLHQADLMAPPTTAIYYWKQDSSPIPEPPGGYHDGPLAGRRA